MAQIDQLTGSGADVISQTLGRLSNKAGVLATVVLDRSTGSILKTTGHFSSRSTSALIASQSQNTTSNTLTDDDNSETTREAQGVEELASMVWNFVNAAGGLVQGLDSEDEVKLLRLRTKKHELVIVPDSKYLLIVVHDTSPA